MFWRHDLGGDKFADACSLTGRSANSVHERGTLEALEACFLQLRHRVLLHVIRRIESLIQRLHDFVRADIAHFKIAFLGLRQECFVLESVGECVLQRFQPVSGHFGRRDKWPDVDKVAEGKAQYVAVCLVRHKVHDEWHALL